MATISTKTAPRAVAARPRLRLFVSYAHADRALADNLLGPLISHLEVSRSFAWECWRDDWQWVQLE
jgi:hypothetical protein